MSTWVIGDVHGCYDAFLELLNNPEIKPEDTVTLIGDIIDRGPQSPEMIEWAMKNITDDGKFQMILGNHEDNIIWEYDEQKARYEKYHPGQKFADADLSRLKCQYGFDGYMWSEEKGQVRDIEHIVKWFRTLPLAKRVTVTKPDGIPQEYVITHAWYFAEGASREEILWYRDISDFGPYFLDDYVPFGNETLVHGHTPTFKENGYPENATVHFREHSVNIDCGACFPQWGGRLAALRLEDGKVIYATQEPWEIEAYE